jgi:hypothetical protein
MPAKKRHFTEEQALDYVLGETIGGFNELADDYGIPSNHPVRLLNSDLQQMSKRVGELEDAAKAIEASAQQKPHDPARKALKQLPALAGALGDVAGSLRSAVVLRQQGGSDQDVAAESLRITGSCLEIAATAAVIAPPPYGKVAAAIIQAIQSLVNFVATILDLAHPAKKEPSVAEIVDNAVRSAHGFAQRNLLNGVLAQLNHMRAGLAELHRQKSDAKRHRGFETWPEIWNLVELPAGQGVDVRVDSMPSWLMDEKNLDLDPDPWGEVFYLYLLAKGQYLRNWLSAMLLPNQPDAGDGGVDDPKFLINGDFAVAAVQLNSIVHTEQSILRQLTPFAVRKAMGVMIGSQGELISSKKGFEFEGADWPFAQKLSGGAITHVAAGPGRRVWALANGGLFFCLLNDKAIQQDFDRYPPGGVMAEQFLENARVVERQVEPKHHDLCVVRSGNRASNVHVLVSGLDRGQQVAPWVYRWDEEKVGTRQPWDRTFYEKMETAGVGGTYAVGEWSCLAAGPGKCAYLLAKGSPPRLKRFDHAQEAREKQPRDVTVPLGMAGARTLGLSASGDWLYVFGGQDIWYRAHDDIARGANTDWARIAPPTTAPDGRTMPAGWSYESVVESEGGALLATINLPGIGTRFYMWHDDAWDIGAANAHGRMLITLPLDSHATFNALKSKVDELVGEGQPT